MPLINVCVATTPLNHENIEQDVVDAWTRSGQGKWVKEHARKIETHLESSWADNTFIIRIYADFDKDTYIAFKLMWPKVNDV